MPIYHLVAKKASKERRNIHRKILIAFSKIFCSLADKLVDTNLSRVSELIYSILNHKLAVAKTCFHILNPIMLRGVHTISSHLCSDNSGVQDIEPYRGQIIALPQVL